MSLPTENGMEIPPERSVRVRMSNGDTYFLTAAENEQLMRSLNSNYSTSLVSGAFRLSPGVARAEQASALLIVSHIVAIEVPRE